MAEAIVRTLAIQSLVGGGLILVMLLLRKCLGGKVAHGLVYGLWLVVALRLLVPIALPRPVSLPSAPRVTVQQAQWAADGEAQAPRQRAVAARSIRAAQAPAAQPVLEKAAPAPSAPSPASGAPLGVAQWLLLIWLAGAGLTLHYMFWVNRRWRMRVMETASPLDIQAPVPVLLADVPSPCLMGALRPVIVLNARAAQPDNLPYALAHELGHLRGLDPLWNLVRNALLALYWFHPLLWVAARCLAKDCERACDQRVTRALDRDASIAYARTLIDLVSPGRPAPAASFMAANLPDMKARVRLVLTKNRGKKWACALFAGLLALTCVASFATGEAVMREVQLPRAFSEAPVYYPTPDGLWVALDGRLYRQSGEDAYREIAAVDSAAQVAADGQGAYVLQPDQKRILMVDAQGAQKAWALPDELSPFKLEVAGDKLAILCGLPASLELGRSTAQGKLYLLDKASGQLSEAQLGTVTDVSSDGAGGLVVLHVPTPGATDALITRLNPRDMRTSTVAQARLDVQYVAAEPGMCYTCQWGTLQQYDEATGVWTQIPIDGDGPMDALRDVRVSGGKLYAWDEAARQLITIDVSERRAADKTVLTVVNRHGFDEAYDSAKAAFLARHPDVELRDITMDYEPYTTALLAGDPGMDILFEGSGAIEKYARAGALLPLTGQPTVMDALAQAQWMPFEDIYSVDGQLYAVPAYVMYNMWRVDGALAQRANFAMPSYPFTWRDVYEAAQAAGLGQPGKPVLMYDYSGNPDILYNYVMAEVQAKGTLNFDTPGFREDMEAYRQMVSQGIIVVQDEYGASPNIPAIIGTMADITDDTVPTPTVNGRQVALMQSYGFCVNARSDNRALALEFVAEFARPKHQYQGNYGYQETMLLMDAAPYSRVNYDDPHCGIERFTPKMEQLRQFAAGKWVTWNTKLHPVSLLEHTGALPKYLDGSLSIDQFIRTLQSRADMMQYE